MLEYVTAGLSTVISWVGTVVQAMITEAGALGPLMELFAIGVSISAVLLGIRVIRGLIWGA